jgi:hypothetical protein
VNQLRQLMLEELGRRNFADTTIRSYLHGVAHFSSYFHRLGGYATVEMGQVPATSGGSCPSR